MNIKKHTKLFYGLGVFFMLIVPDQMTKTLANEIFENYKFAFSLPVPLVFMYGIYFFAISVILFYVYQNYQKFFNYEKLAWGFILAGAVSNVGERIVLGFVRDWIYIYTGVFNLADGYIILGVLILFIKSLLNTKKTKYEI